MIGAFESTDPAVNASERYASPAVTLVIVGAPGRAAGWTRTLGELGILFPATFVVTTE